MRQSSRSSLEAHRIKIELKDNNQKIQKLENSKYETEQQVKQSENKRRQLEKENDKLKAQLQAKAQLKEKRGAVAYAAEVPKPKVGSIQAIIVAAANKYGVSASKMLRMASCESSYNPGEIASNFIDGGHPAGLFQHVTTYWPARAAKYGWPGASVFNAKANAEVTAQMLRDGLGGLWECQ